MGRNASEAEWIQKGYLAQNLGKKAMLALKTKTY